MEKAKYLKISFEQLTKVFSKAGAKATIDVMAKLRLSSVNDVDQSLINHCNMVLYERVKMLKGGITAAKFYTSLQNACR